MVVAVPARVVNLDAFIYFELVEWYMVVHDNGADTVNGICSVAAIKMKDPSP